MVSISSAEITNGIEGALRPGARTGRFLTKLEEHAVFTSNETEAVISIYVRTDERQGYMVVRPTIEHFGSG